MPSNEHLPARFYKALFTIVDNMRDRAGVRREFSNDWRVTVQQVRLLRTVERLTRMKSPEGVMLKSLIPALITFNGNLLSWWGKIATGLLLLLFICIQKIVVRTTDRRNVKTTKAAAKE